jgi:hypothetical protein
MRIYNKLFLVVLAACTSAIEDVAPEDPGLPAGSTTGGDDTTYDHDNSGISPWQLIERLQKVGPPRYSSKVHGCAKMRVETLGRVLTSLGVDITNQTDLSAGKLYRDGMNAMGGPNFQNRIRENVGISTSGASRLFDIFAAGADEVITAVPNLERCKVNGIPAQLFDGNACRIDGLTCLLGTPAQTAHVELCNVTIQNASDPEIGKRLAVASILAAANTCE